MKDEIIIEIIKITPSFIWPITIIIIITFFHKDLKKLLSRIKSGSIFGNDFILEEKVEKLEEIVDAKKIASNKKDKVFESKAYTNENPVGKLVMLSALIEKELRQLMYKSGWFNSVRIGTVKNIINFLVSNKTLPGNILSSIDLFMDIRNKVVHGTESIQDDQIERVIEIGFIILSQIRSIPLSDYIVEVPKVDLYADENCKEKIENAFGVILKEYNSITNSTKYSIYPTSITYRKGISVSWEWDLNNVFNITYYKDPKTGKNAKAWDSSALFVGRNIEEI